MSRVVLVGALCVLVASVPAAAQQRGSISGRVVDTGGLVLPGATMTVTEQATGFNRTVVTASTGAYAVPNLEPGVVVVELAGFAPTRRPDLTLTAGSALTLEFRMQLAGVQEEVVVTAEAPLVETTSHQIGGTLSSREIEEIPSNFRNFTALTQLVPGITPNPAASSFEGGQVVANGTPSQQNVYLIDGMYNNDDRLGGSQGTQVRVVLDNIEEYQVLSNQYSAEYGGGAGAIINMITRSGTNAFHGRVYSYFRDGRDPFSIGQRNVHPSYITGRGGEGLNTRIRTYVIDEALSYFAPNLWGSEHNFKVGAGIGFHQMPPRTTFHSGIFEFRSDAPYDPADPATHPFQFTAVVGPPSDWGYEVTSKERPPAADARQQVGGFFSYPPVVLDLTLAGEPRRGAAERGGAGGAQSAPRPDPRRVDVQPEPVGGRPRPSAAVHVVVERRREPPDLQQRRDCRRLRRQRLARSARRHRPQRAGQPRAPRHRRHRSDRPAHPARRAPDDVQPGAAGTDLAALQRRLQVPAAVVRAPHGQPLERGVAYTVQQSHYVGLGNPDARRVWLDHDPRADYGRFTSDRRHVLAMSGTINPWSTLSVAAVVSAISGAPINETVGRDVNGDSDNTDRPIRGIDDLVMPIRSDVDEQGRAVINGLEGPGSFLVDVSFRYQIPLAGGLESVDLFYDVFNILNRENLVAPTGNRASPNFMVSTAAQFPRQMQFGIRVRF